MKTLTFNDLLAGVKRTLSVEIAGAGTVVLHELSGAEAATLRAASAEVSPTDVDANEKFVAQWAGRLLKGSMPTEDEQAALLAANSPDVLLQVYRNGLQFNLAQETSREDIEKN